MNLVSLSNSLPSLYLHCLILDDLLRGFKTGMHSCVFKSRCKFRQFSILLDPFSIALNRPSHPAAPEICIFKYLFNNPG